MRSPELAIARGRRVEDRAGGGQPDSFTVESWFEFPRQLLPETGPNTFTRLARDFAAQVRGLYPGE